MPYVTLLFTLAVAGAMGGSPVGIGVGLGLGVATTASDFEIEVDTVLENGGRFVSPGDVTEDWYVRVRVLMSAASAPPVWSPEATVKMQGVLLLTVSPQAVKIIAAAEVPEPDVLAVNATVPQLLVTEGDSVVKVNPGSKAITVSAAAMGKLGWKPNAMEEAVLAVGDAIVKLVVPSERSTTASEEVRGAAAVLLSMAIVRVFRFAG